MLNHLLKINHISTLLLNLVMLLLTNLMLILGILFQLMVLSSILLLLWVYYHSRVQTQLLLESLMLNQIALNSKCKNGCILISNTLLKPFLIWLLKEVLTNLLMVLGLKPVQLKRFKTSGRIFNSLMTLLLLLLFLPRSVLNNREKLIMLESIVLLRLDSNVKLMLKRNNKLLNLKKSAGLLGQLLLTMLKLTGTLELMKKSIKFLKK